MPHGRGAATGAALKLLAIAGATVAASIVGFIASSRWLLPLLDAAPAWFAMVIALRRGHRRAAIGLMAWWALCLALTTIALSMVWHARAEQVILNGAAYRDEMASWLSTGVGREATPSQFIPQHLAHAAIFCALAAATGAAASIVMGSALLNYMSFYVGDLLLRCSGAPERGLAFLLAWNPWSAVRVMSFIILGVTLAEPLLGRFRGAWPAPEGRGRWVAAGAAGLVVDILLKTLLAPLWPGLIGGCLG